MKRFVVIVTSLLIIFVFVALNYLLWDRESLVTLRESNQASIDALSRINMNLGDEKSRLLEQNSVLMEQVSELKAKVEVMEKDIQDKQSRIDEQTDFTLAMKQHLNPLPIKTAALDWINLLSKRTYGSAFMRGETDCRYWQNKWNLRTFTDYFEQNLDQIQIKLDEEQLPIIKVNPSPSTDWDINVELHALVELKENAKEDYLKQGENIFKITYTYNERIEQWLISSVTSEAAEEEPQPESEPETETSQDNESEPNN